MKAFFLERYLMNSRCQWEGGVPMPEDRVPLVSTPAQTKQCLVNMPTWAQKETIPLWLEINKRHIWPKKTLTRRKAAGPEPERSMTLQKCPKQEKTLCLASICLASPIDITPLETLPLGWGGWKQSKCITRDSTNRIKAKLNFVSRLCVHNCRFGTELPFNMGIVGKGADHLRACLLNLYHRMGPTM